MRKSVQKNDSSKNIKKSKPSLKENLIKSFDAGVSVKPQTTTNYNLMTSLLTSNRGE